MHLEYLAKGRYEPFWGNSTSSVNWCEVDYEYSNYIAELFNTTSSLFIVMAGCYGSVLHRKWIKLSFHCAFLSTAVVGLGSIAFHATLKKSTQALDEVPMLFSAMSFLYVSIQLHLDLGQRKRQSLGWYHRLIVGHC
jgi:dihydroceramidase